MLNAAVLAVMTPPHQRMLDSRLRGNDTVVFSGFDYAPSLSISPASFASLLVSPPAEWVERVIDTLL